MAIRKVFPFFKCERDHMGFIINNVPYDLKRYSSTENQAWEKLYNEMQDRLEIPNSNDKKGEIRVDYYQVFADCLDVDDYCAKYNVSFFVGNILKAVVRMDKKNGGKDSIRDLKKIIHYANKEIKRRLKEVEGE